MPPDAPAEFEGVTTMTLFRNAIITITGLNLKHEGDSACAAMGKNSKKDRKSVYGRYALRNHLRSRLRQKLVACNKVSIAIKGAPVWAVLRGRPLVRKRSSKEGRPRRTAHTGVTNSPVHTTRTSIGISRRSM